MPVRDKTGPEGKGPKTGRGLGDCSPEDEKDIEKETKAAYDEVINRGRNSFSRKRPTSGRRPKRIGSQDGSGDGRGDGTNSQNGSGRPASGGRGRNRR